MESNLYWNLWCLKSQRLTLKIEISKISSIDLKMRCTILKWSKVMSWLKPKEILQNYVVIFLWEVIFVHFYNWDRPLDLVLVVYHLIELIIEASLWTMDFSIFDSHTQHTTLLFNECLFHLCDCTCSNVMYLLNYLLIKPKNIFEYFICFWKCFYAFVFWVFVQIAFFMFFIKNSFRGIFARSSRVSFSHENG